MPLGYGTALGGQAVVNHILTKLNDLDDVNSTGIADGDRPGWDAATSTWTMRASDGVFNVKDYGAVGDGATDDTTAIQAAITAAVAAKGGLVLIPSGEYLVSSTLNMRINSLYGSGLTLQGQGFANSTMAPTNYATRLRWTGAAGGTLLDMSGCCYCSVKNLGLIANNSAAYTNSTQIGINIQGNPTYGGTFFNTFDELYFQNFGQAVILGTTSGTDQVDTHTFNKCWFSIGTTGTGVVNHSSNALINSFNACSFIGGSAPSTATGVLVNNGSVRLRDCCTAYMHYGVRFSATPAAGSDILGHHSELDDYPVYCDSVSGNHQKARPLHITNFFAYTSGTELLHLGNENMLYMVESLQSTNGTPANDAIIVPDDPQEVFLWNCSFAGGVKRLSDGAAVTVHGYYGAQGASAWTARTPFNNSAAATTLGNVVKKIEVFNASGTSLGYLAVYDGIT